MTYGYDAAFTVQAISNILERKCGGDLRTHRVSLVFREIILLRSANYSGTCGEIHYEEKGIGEFWSGALSPRSSPAFNNIDNARYANKKRPIEARRAAPVRVRHPLPGRENCLKKRAGGYAVGNFKNLELQQLKIEMYFGQNILHMLAARG